MIVKGNLKIEHKSGERPLDEDDHSHNFNPSGAPYQGLTDLDQKDVYPNEIQGLVHCSGDLELERTSLVCGAIICEGMVTVTDHPVIAHSLYLMTDARRVLENQDSANDACPGHMAKSCGLTASPLTRSHTSVKPRSERCLRPGRSRPNRTASREGTRTPNAGGGTLTLTGFHSHRILNPPSSPRKSLSNNNHTRMSPSSGALAADDPDLMAVADAWSSLPDIVKTGIVAMVKATSTKTTDD